MWNRVPDVRPRDDVQVFFAEDKAMPGWSVVLKKDARGRRISPTGLEHCLGQEESSGDRCVFGSVGGGTREASDENEVVVGTQQGWRGSRTRWRQTQ